MSLAHFMSSIYTKYCQWIYATLERTPHAKLGNYLEEGEVILKATGWTNIGIFFKNRKYNGNSHSSCSVIKEFIDFMFHVCIIELRTSIVELFPAQRSSKNYVIHKLVYNLLSK